MQNIWSDAELAELADDEPDAESSSDDGVAFDSFAKEELEPATLEKMNEMDERKRKRNEAKRRLQTLDNKEWAKGDWTIKLDNEKRKSAELG